jgi:PAS domain S-box-containing protein
VEPSPTDSNEALKDRARTLAAVIERTADLVAVARPDGELVYVNPAGRTFLGWSSEPVDGTLTELFAQDEHEKLEKVVVEAVLSTGTWEGELCFRHRVSGEGIPMWSRLVTIPCERTGTVAGIATVSRDVTAQKVAERRLRASELRFRTLTRLAPVGLFFTDADGRLTFGNRRWAEMTECGEIGDTSRAPLEWLQSFHREDRDRVRAAWESLVREEDEIELQCRIVGPSGVERWVHLSLTILTDSEPAVSGGEQTVSGYIGSCLDVTDHVRNEERLQRAAEALTRSNSDLERFAWVASHDLKEPLRVVANYVTLLERKYADHFDENARRYIRYAVEGTQRMWSLIDGILAFSGVDHGARPVREVDTGDVFDTVVDNLQMVVQESGATIHRTDFPRVMGDPAQLGQLFQNLLANAIKFRGDSAPRIEAGVERQRGFWRFFVRDNGIGIDPRFHAQVFDVFRRLHTRSRYPGSGVGLAICKRIVEKHGGSMSVESRPGEGTTFYFTLPAVDAGVGAPAYEGLPAL